MKKMKWSCRNGLQSPARITLVSVIAVAAVLTTSMAALAAPIAGSSTNGTPAVTGTASGAGYAGSFSASDSLWSVSATNTSTCELCGGGIVGTGTYLGILGTCTGTSCTGIEGDSTSGIGLLGTATTGTGVSGTSSSGNGVQGVCTAGSASGVYGQNNTAGGFGVAGRNTATTGTGVAVWGDANNNLTGSWAGYFSGRVNVTGTVSKGGGSFLIDHPLDPTNKYLVHSFVESPDMKNIYDGVTVLDGRGQARVVMPAWFEALNMDFRYQLTCIGGHAPIFISREMKGNEFWIAGGTPGLKVSWQVTGTRNDAFAAKYRLPVEYDKPSGEKGRYLYPEAFGQPHDRGMNHPIAGMPLGPEQQEAYRRGLLNLGSTAEMRAPCIGAGCSTAASSP